jgi:hypothetical protein
VTAVPLCRLPAGATVALDLVRAEDGSAPRWPTRVELEHRVETLEIRFDCRDDDPWGTLLERDAPLWTEEVVEVFLAPGAVDPYRYFELELSPNGIVFDGRVESPDLDRRTMRVDTSWDCPGLDARAAIVSGYGWRAELALPWRALHGGGGPPPPVWRINLYRIERPRPGATVDGTESPEPEHSAWSPTWRTPADFHRPAFFGLLELR